MNTIGEIWIDKRIVQTQNGVIINAWPQFFKNSGASRYLILDMSDMWFPCEAIVKNDAKEFCFWSFLDLLAIEF